MNTLDRSSPSEVDQDDVTCRAFRLALAATQVTIAWHARALDSETAMKVLGSLITDSGLVSHDDHSERVNRDALLVG
jgi:hypothetical protein